MAGSSSRGPRPAAPQCHSGRSLQSLWGIRGCQRGGGLYQEPLNPSPASPTQHHATVIAPITPTLTLHSLIHPPAPRRSPRWARPRPPSCPACAWARSWRPPLRRRGAACCRGTSSRGWGSCRCRPGHRRCVGQKGYRGVQGAQRSGKIAGVEMGSGLRRATWVSVKQTKRANPRDDGRRINGW